MRRWQDMDKRLRGHIWQYVLILAGCAVGAAAYPLFLVSNGIAPGGVTGIATVLNHAFGWPVGMTSLVMNVPLFILGYRAMGRGFVVRTLVATIVFSLLIDLFRFEPVTRDPLLSSTFGAVFLGVGIGIIMRGAATTGGTDLLARVVHQKWSVISVGAFLFALDCAVVLLAGVTMSAEHAMYSMIAVFICTKLIDVVLAGLGTDKACYVITAHADTIASRLMSQMGRGVTLLDAVGAYSGAPVKMLVCVVARMEIMQLKAIVKDEDPRAFMFITDTHETLGEGFQELLPKPD